MKRFFLFAAAAAALLFLSLKASAWGGIGHQTTVAVAMRHITDRARRNIEAFYPGPVVKDASWMDKHRRDAEYAYTGSYHTMAMNHDGIYDPTWRIEKGGDCVTGLRFSDYCLSHMDQLHLTDSAKIFQVRILIHIVGDMHCPCHSYIMPERNQWKCTFRGEHYRYHGFIDHIPDLMFEGMTIDEIAEKVDTWKKGPIRKICKGTFEDWAQEICDRDQEIYRVNPYGTKELDPDTVEKLRPCIEEALAVGGYRLAFLLNKYFDY